MGNFCKCLHSVCLPPVCLSVCCLLVMGGLAAQQSASSQTFADQESMTIPIIRSSLPLQPLPGCSLLCGTESLPLLGGIALASGITCTMLPHPCLACLHSPAQPLSAYSALTLAPTSSKTLHYKWSKHNIIL